MCPSHLLALCGRHILDISAILAAVAVIAASAFLVICAMPVAVAVITVVAVAIELAKRFLKSLENHHLWDPLRQ